MKCYEAPVPLGTYYRADEADTEITRLRQRVEELEKATELYHDALYDIAHNMLCGEGGDSYKMRAVATDALNAAIDAAMESTLPPRSDT